MILVLAVGVALRATIASPPLHYPLDYHPSVTSTFGTYRINHHHAGLDLFTDDKEDVKVLAADAGTVFLIKRTQAGYGRSVYVRHAGGRVTVYGHLGRFSPELEKVVSAQETKDKGYRLRIRPNPQLKVERGESLGWVGTSGTDLVHLHFELRQENVPVNPLTNGLVVPDPDPPRIKRLLVVPFDAHAHVGQTSDEHYIEVSGDTIEPIAIGGKVQLYVEIQDRIPGSERGLTPYEIRFSVDGRLRHHIRYDKAPYNEKFATDLDYHPGLRHLERGDFHKLFREGPGLTVRPTEDTRLLADLDPGAHTAEIATRDAAGNEAKLRFTLDVGPAKPPCAPGALKATPPQKTLPPAATRVWRNNTLLLPIGGLCTEGASAAVVRIGGRPTKRWRVTQFEGAPALAVDVPPDREEGAIEVGTREGLTRVGAMPLREGATVRSVDGAVEFAVGEGALFFPVQNELILGPPAQVSGLEAVTPLYTFLQPFRPVRGASRIGIKLPGGVTPSKEIGVYLIAGKWWYLGRKLEHDRLFGIAMRPVAFALMRDRDPPIVKAVRVDPHPVGDRLVVEYEDPGSGVASFALKVDGREVYAERQAAFSRLLWRPWEPLGPGPHTVEVELADHAGHSTAYKASVEWLTR